MFVTVPDLAWQGSLLCLDDPSVDPTFGECRRLPLDDRSWVDHQPGWLRGADLVFGELVARLPWRQRLVPMYGRMVEEPCLSWWWTPDQDELPLPLLEQARGLLSARYGVTFDSLGANLYRDGRDSVAWHADRLRHTQVDPLVAIVSVGVPRPFLLRPRGGGRSRSFALGAGDLLVMGGACQHEWEHTVPKVAAAAPRLSLTFRHDAPAPDSPSRAVDDPRWWP